MESLRRDRSQSYVEPLTLVDRTGWKYTNTRLQVDFLVKAREGGLHHELHEECKAHHDGNEGA